jgi:hypothetical protein
VVYTSGTGGGVGADRGASVAIYRLLQQSAFGPDDTKRMGDAYELALAQLGLKDRNDPLTETVAKLIIEIAQTGEKDPKTICAFALRRLNEPDREAC